MAPIDEIIVQQPRGHPAAPLSDTDLLEKMTWLLEGLASAHTPLRLLDLCSRLSTPEDVQQLVETCSVTPT
jgi:hypothetical protein